VNEVMHGIEWYAHTKLDVVININFFSLWSRNLEIMG